MAFLVDSDWLIDVLNGMSAAANVIERNRAQGPAISIITYSEVLEGAFGYGGTKSTVEGLRLDLAQYPVLGLDEPIMEVFARTRATRISGLVLYSWH